MNILLAATSYKFAHTGRLPFWAALLIVFGVAFLCLVILRAEMRRLRRRRGRHWLYVTRPLILLVFAWLLIQPVLFLRTEHAEHGRLILLLDDSRSMFLRDVYKDPTDRQDLAHLLRLRGLEDRSNLCQSYRVSLEEQRAELERMNAAARRSLEELEQGLPWGPSFTAALKEESERVESWERFAERQAQPLAQLESTLAATDTGNSPAAADQSSNFAAVREHARTCLELRQTIQHWLEQPAWTLEALAGILDTHARLQAQLDAALRALEALQTAADERFLSRAPRELLDALEALEQTPRANLAVQAVERSGILETLSKQHRIDTLLLTGLDGPSGVRTFKDLSQDLAARNTDLYTPIQNLLRKHSLDLLSGIVLLTDGQQNSPRRAKTLEKVAKHRIPFLAVGVGSPQPASDMAIASYRVPALLLAQKKSAAAITVKTAAPAGTPYAVTLRTESQEIARVDAQADGASSAFVTLPFDIQAPGRSVLQIAVQWAGPDANPGNDTASAAVSVLERKPKVLLLAQSARWDLVYLVRILENGPYRLIPHFTNEKEKETARGKEDDKIPDQLSDLKSYDLILLDDEPFKGWKEEDASLFADYVVKAGGSLILIQNFDDRQKASYRSLLARRFPLRVEAPASETNDEGASQGLQVAQDSRFLSLVLLSPEGEESRGRWAQLSAPHHLFPVAAQAIPLLESPDRRSAAFSLGFYGRGRIYHWGVGDLYRLREWHGAGAASQFLAGIIEDAARPLFTETPPAVQSLVTYPSLPLVGQKTQVLLHAPPGQPAPVSLGVQFEDDKRQELEVAHSVADGLFRAEFTPRQPGALTVLAETSLGRVEYKTRAVLPLSRENIDFHLDEPGLERMARDAGGHYVPLARLCQALEAIPKRTRAIVNVREIKLWDLKKVLLLAAVLLTLDWVIRRRAGIIL